MKVFFIFALLFLSIPVLLGLFFGFPTINISNYLTIYSSNNLKGCEIKCSEKVTEIFCSKQINENICTYVCMGKSFENCNR